MRRILPRYGRLKEEPMLEEKLKEAIVDELPVIAGSVAGGP